MSAIIYPLRVLSDLHFRYGRGALKKREQLHKLFAGAGTVVLNGDSVEELDQPREQAQEDFREIKLAAKEVGVNLITLTGNHDPHITDQHELRVAELNLVVRHGDRGRRGEGRPITEPRRRSTGRRFSLRTFRTVLDLWVKYPGMHLRNLDGNLIVGHSHWPGVWRTKRGVLINVGGHSPYPWAFALDIESAAMERWSLRPIGYRNKMPYFKKATAVAPILADHKI